MQPAHATHPPAASAASYALLRCDTLRLLLPQQDIRILELASDVATEAPPTGGVGWISFRQQPVPVFSLTVDLHWHTAIDADRVVCALLETAGHYFGLLCSEAGLVRGSDVALHDVPRIMLARQAPFSRIALQGDQLACVTSAAQLYAYLPAAVRAKWPRLQGAS